MGAEGLLRTNLLLDWWRSTDGQQYGARVFQGAERQADLCANAQQQAAQLHIPGFRETDGVKILQG